ncbi:MAG: hypothetical protein J4F45_01355 [Pseudomonadales bacterium]|nr:hypothetical protein [Pseudomonadales bacterium]
MINRRQVVVGAALAPGAAWLKPAAALGDDGDLARLLIDTPRETLLEVLASRIHAGLQPRQLLGGLAVATCREVSPFPNVGFKYHAVMMLRSVEQSVAAMSGDRAWLPLLWTADYFKAAAAQQERIRPWSLPSREARSVDVVELGDSLTSWDGERTDRATAALVAAGRTPVVLQTLMLHAARDFRAIGHKTIAAANAHRLHTALGESVAAPLARSLALAVQNAEGDDPARHAYPADGDWQANQELAATLPPDWRVGRDDIAAGRTLVQELRTASSDQAAKVAVDMLNDNVGAHTVWEAVMMFAAELILRRNGIVALHATTTANAMHYCYLMAVEDRARRLQLLQAVAFMARFRSLVDSDRRTRNRLIGDIDPLPASVRLAGVATSPCGKRLDGSTRAETRRPWRPVRGGTPRSRTRAPTTSSSSKRCSRTIVGCACLGATRSSRRVSCTRTAAATRTTWSWSGRRNCWDSAAKTPRGLGVRPQPPPARPVGALENAAHSRVQAQFGSGEVRQAARHQPPSRRDVERHRTPRDHRAVWRSKARSKLTKRRISEL